MGAGKWVPGMGSARFTAKPSSCLEIVFEALQPPLGGKTRQSVPFASKPLFLLKLTTRNICICCTVTTPNKGKRHPRDTAPLLKL